MVSLNSIDQSFDNYFKDTSETPPLDHLLEEQQNIEEDFRLLVPKQQLLRRKLMKFVSELSGNILFDLIEEIYQLKMQLIEIESNVKIIEEKSIEKDDIQLLQNNIRIFQTMFKNLKEKRKSIISDENSQMSLSSNLSVNSRYSSQSDDIPSQNSLTTTRTSDNSSISHLLFKQISPAMLDIHQHDNNQFNYEDEHIIGIDDSQSKATIRQKIRLSNNIVSVMRGPFRVMVDGTIHAIEVCAKETHEKSHLIETVKQGLQRQIHFNTQEEKNSSLKNAFIQITDDWIFQGENLDKGFSSASFWMKNPHGQRILVKNQDLPICAANEWIAYVLGIYIGLPINEVQISIYQNNLVTTHTDVAINNEKTFTFMDLPKYIQKMLLQNPLLEQMDLFDRIIQNVDRNPRNILITIPNDQNIKQKNVKLKIHLIDHGSSFGMGKLNGISVIASKLHTQHLSIVKFDPIVQANKFHSYLSKFPIQDRIFLTNILHRFANIDNQLFNFWIDQIKDLLSLSQYQRIKDVLYRQRDIAKHYTIQWNLHPRSSSINHQDDNFITFF